MEKIKNIFIVCGEPSGDLLAGSLIEALKRFSPNIKVSGVGGPCLAKAGCEIFCNIKDFSVMGFFDVLKKLPRFVGLRKLILNKINSDNPDAVILVDFSGFNLRLAKAINKRIPCIYYVSPQVWASREGRIKSIEKFISKMIVLFKFEEDFYKKHGIEASWVGHPLIDLVKPVLEKNDFLSNYRLNPANKTIALLPGSRKQEVRLILPVMLKAASIIAGKITRPQFIIAKASSLDTQVYQNEIKKFDLDVKIIEGLTSDCINCADASIVCSGTATLEAAIIQKPFVIAYKTNLLNYLLYRPLVKIPYIGLVNIVAAKMIVPEFLQFDATAEKISESVINLLNNPEASGQMTEELGKVKAILGRSGAASRAAKIILDFLS